jgi:putative MFS transporter
MSTTQPAAPGATRVAVAARLDRIPPTRWHVMIRLLVGTVTFFQGFDQLLIAYTLPVLRKSWHLSSGESTAVATSGSWGMLVGALIAGRLADRFGRVRVIAACFVVTGVSSLAAGLCHSPGTFMVARVVQGVAIGGEVPIAATYIAEIVRSRHRGRFVLMYELVFPMGLLLGGLAAYWVVPHWGWQRLYELAAIPSLVVFALKVVPESPRWLESRGRQAEADAIVDRIESEYRKTGHELPPIVQGAPAETTKARLADLFAGRYARRTVMLWIAWFAAFFANYGIATWLPSIYISAYHLSLSKSLLYTSLTTGAGAVGCLIAALSVERIGRKGAISISFAFSALPLFLLAAIGGSSATQVLVWTALASLFNFAVNVVLYVYTPELYPTRVRALGTSAAGAFARVGMIIGPSLVPAIYAGGTDTASIWCMLAAVLAVGMVIVVLLGEETTGRRLEDVSP